MNETLEYKLLEYLLNNNEGLFIDVSHITDNTTLLKSVIKDLKERKFIETKEYPGKPFDDPNWVGITPSEKPNKCKITYLGIEHINKINSNKIELTLAKSNIKANNLNLRNSIFNNRVNVANIIISVINILVALGLAWWSHKVGILK